MANDKKQQRYKNNKSIKQDFDFARFGLTIGAITLFPSTAFMNVPAWMEQAVTVPQALANGGLASSFELMALCGLSWAGYQFVQGRKRRR